MRRSTAFTFIFVAILGVIGYMWYGYMHLPAGVAPAAEDNFSRTLGDLARLKNLTIDTTLFQERFFTELEAPREIPEPSATPGRQNPFAIFK